VDPAPDLNIIDRFMAAFSAYIDSGFGLLGPDVGFLTTTLIAIDSRWRGYGGRWKATTTSWAG